MVAFCRGWWTRALLSLVVLFLFGGLTGCAASSTTDDSTGAGNAGPTSGPGGGTGQGGMGAQGGFGAEGGMGGFGGMGGESGEGGMGGGDICDMGCPVGFWDIDDNPLTGDCGCEYACDKISDDDPIDPNYDDDNCDGGDGVVEQCVYVSTTIGMPNGAGTRADPVDTIATGIQVADTMNVPAVCVSGEGYNEQVTVLSGISVYGGFDHQDPDFAFRRSPNVTTTVSATGVVFDAPQIDAETHIAGFTMNAAQLAMPGSSTYGVRAGNGIGHLFVEHNIINVAAGTAGAPGANGAPHPNPTAPNGNNGTNGCEGTNCGFGGPQPACLEFGGKGGDGGFDSGSGQNGSPGSGGAVGGNGASGDSCFGGGNNGGSGGTGSPNGPQGMPGMGGPNIGMVNGAGFYLPANGGNGAIGQNGKGGGSGGCGGLGGNFGLGGGGGGGSFGVFSGGATITVIGNQITTAGGGAGGTGGNGANGQGGGSGGAGGGGNDDSGSGGGGGPGSNGGAGGPGGGGGGGPSACLGYGFGTTFTFTMNTSCTVGLPGVGGAGGTNNQGGSATAGANGQAAPTLQIN